MEDQPVEVIGQIGQGEFGLSALEADGADIQTKPVLLMRKDMLEMGADRGFGRIGPCYRP